MRGLFWIMLCSCLGSFSLQAATQHKLEYITEQYPPYNYVEQGELKGIAVDILHLVWQRLGQPKQAIRFLPWDRGYYLALQKKHTVLFSTTRIKSRETLFKWACPIGFMEVVILGYRKDGIELKQLDDAKNYRLMVAKSDVGEQKMLLSGFNDVDLESVDSNRKMAEALIQDKTDLLVGGRVPLLTSLQELGKKADDFEVKWVVTSNPLCFAFNRDTDPQRVANFQKALNEVLADLVQMQTILKKYGQW
ncbi:substrate-binding periplasmic protein [Dongshaea marina]|uniref:substrate-binding periplasmic protein n=1 Tax=Dongshaea marina TaxID=2047966 RepID=UPI000D3E1E5D|nr:transporter substrate-binding domain-containing protein [Dongshaea marina]